MACGDLTDQWVKCGLDNLTVGRVGMTVRERVTVVVFVANGAVACAKAYLEREVEMISGCLAVISRINGSSVGWKGYGLIKRNVVDCDEVACARRMLP